jgi:hypothetical protein
MSSRVLKQKLSDPASVLKLLGGIAGIALLVLFIKRIHGGGENKLYGGSDDKNKKSTTIFSKISTDSVIESETNSDVPGGHVISTVAGRGPDVGRDTYKFAYPPESCEKKLNVWNMDVSLNLPTSVTPPGPVASPAVNVPGPVAAINEEHALQNQYMLNSDDVNIDPRILKQWAVHEAKYQENTTLKRDGQFWAKNWEALGPLDPFTPRHQSLESENQMEVTPGPTDPQLAYANALVASMDEQARKFCVSENPNDVTYQYRNQLQQIPGSHFETFDASWDAHDTPRVVNRRAHLPQMAARWVVMQLNEKFRKEHPCFSLSGREHFELSNPPQVCGGGGTDGFNQKENPITLIRVFESRLVKLNSEACNPGQVRQKLYLTMEIGNHVSAGAGGMFHTVVSIDDRGNFVDYTTPQRDKKQTFVLPRTRTDAS